MKTLIKISVPLGILTILLALSVALRLALKTYVSFPFNQHEFSGNLFLSVASLLVAFAAIYLLVQPNWGRFYLPHEEPDPEPAYDQQPILREQKAFDKKQKSLTGVSKDGDITSHRLSRDPKTSRNMSRLRLREQRRKHLQAVPPRH